MSTPQYMAKPANPNGTAVMTRGLVKQYGDFRAVDDLNLNVPAHGIYGLLGPNGAGKSTTMKLLLGLTGATAGDMWMLGEQVDGRHYLQPGRVGSMIEGPSFYPGLSGLDNCRMVADYLNLPRDSANAILKQVGLAGHENKWAKDYSLGMKQRLGIAMALISRPELLLLDEPTNGLDAEAVVEVREMIVELAKSSGVTVIISSHILSEIEKMAPVVGIIARGHLLYQGSLDDLREEGHIDLRVSDPQAAAALFATNQIEYRWLPETGVLRLPELSDDRMGGLVAQLVGRGVGIYRIASERKSLEQAFLELVEHPDGRSAAARTPRASSYSNPACAAANARSTMRGTETIRHMAPVGRAAATTYRTNGGAR